MADNSSDLPSSKLARAQVVGSAAIDSGITRLRYAVRGLGSSNREEISNQKDEEIARRVFAAMSKLRGTALKISQMLATEHDMLPEAARRELARAAFRAPPLNRAVARRIVQSELGGKPPEALFTVFETQAFAAASLGQVHRAVTRDGEELALKLQYPGIDKAISSDVQMVRALIKTIRPFSVTDQRRREVKSLDPMLDEIEARLYEEVDYIREAESSEWFRKNLNHPQIYIPKVYHEWSTKHVLATERLKGLHLEEWLETEPGQTEVDRLGQILSEVFFKSMFELRRVHSDPNLGNYLFLEDGRIGMLDFGCVDTISKEVIAFFGLCMHGYMSGDLDAVISEYQIAGLISAELDAPTREKFHRFMKPAQDWVAVSLAAPSIDFAEHQDILIHIREAAMSMGPAFEQPSGNFSGLLYLSRAFVGLFRMLRIMNAKVELNKLIPPRETFLTMREELERSTLQ